LKAALVRRILRRGYVLSVDNGKELLLRNSDDINDILAALKTASDLIWVNTSEGSKLGWMKINSKTGEILDYSTRDRRLTDLVADEFLG
jgi:hypothetical protein